MYSTCCESNQRADVKFTKSIGDLIIKISRRNAEDNPILLNLDLICQFGLCLIPTWVLIWVQILRLSQVDDDDDRMRCQLSTVDVRLR